jgi:hypothetical protein
VVLAEKISGELHYVAANGTRMEFFLIVQILTLKTRFWERKVGWNFGGGRAT